MKILKKTFIGSSSGQQKEDKQSKTKDNKKRGSFIEGPSEGLLQYPNPGSFVEKSPQFS